MDDEIEDEFNLEIMEDPSRTSLTSLISDQMEVSIPWKKGNAIVMGGGVILSEGTQRQQPIRSTPFDTSDPLTTSFVFHEQGSSNYREEISNDSSSSMKHMSGSIEVNVNLVLIGGSARGEYDKLARANTDSEKASIHSNFRVGVIKFKDMPQLAAWEDVPSRFASRARHKRFVETYGDYYVGGLVLGGDNSLMLSASESSSSESESLHIKATVRVLFSEESFEESYYQQSSSLNSQVNVAGFDSLEGTVIDIRPQPRPLPPGFTAESLARLIGGNSFIVAIIIKLLQQPRTDFHVDWKMISGQIEKARKLEARIRDKMDSFKLKEGAEVSMETCAALIQSGLVVEILLCPMSKHPEYVEARARLY